MSDDEIVYNDESDYISWLTVERLANYMVVLDPTLAQVNQDPEQESWDNAVGKYSVDEAFVDSNDTKLSVDIRHSDEVSGHDWVSAQVKMGLKEKIVLAGKPTLCGKPLTKCNMLGKGCKHEYYLESFEIVDDIRDEFIESWNSLSDRPTENNFIGLPGLRYIDDTTYFIRNILCLECRIYTPKEFTLCQNCDSELAVQV